MLFSPGVRLCCGVVCPAALWRGVYGVACCIVPGCVYGQTYRAVQFGVSGCFVPDWSSGQTHPGLVVLWRGANAVRLRLCLIAAMGTDP
jgi:hypothetical protein